MAKGNATADAWLNETRGRVRGALALLGEVDTVTAGDAERILDVRQHLSKLLADCVEAAKQWRIARAGLGRAEASCSRQRKMIAGMSAAMRRARPVRTTGM